MRLVTLWPSAHPAPSSDAVAMLAHPCRSLSDASHWNASFYVPGLCRTSPRPSDWQRGATFTTSSP
jgi:hypothetical protein